jgi:TRAP-type C4-dicarboxylate transport system permease small subunit
MSGESGLLRAVERLKQVQLWIASFALVAMMLTTSVDVTLRYLINKPVRGAYDLVEAMLVIFVFNGLSSAFLSRGNIVIDVLDKTYGRFIKGLLIRFFDLVTVAVLVVMAWAMVKQGIQAFDYGDRKLELDIPVWYLWIAGLAGLAGVIICALGLFLKPNDGEGAHP